MLKHIDKKMITPIIIPLFRDVIRDHFRGNHTTNALSREKLAISQADTNIHKRKRKKNDLHANGEIVKKFK
jgi:hypothetical protein